MALRQKLTLQQSNCSPQYNYYQNPLYNRLQDVVNYYEQKEISFILTQMQTQAKQRLGPDIVARIQQSLYNAA